MGVDTRRPPLPAPTEDPSSMDNESNLGTDLATEVSRRTDRTSYSIPEDGSPITISTSKLHAPRDGRINLKQQKSQTSLLIEYFEAPKSGDKSRARPSVRVKVTPSATRRSKHGSDAVQITGIGKDRKPSYTRRISLGNKTESTVPIEGTEVSRSSESNVSGRPPIEVEISNHNGSDLSNSHASRDLRYIENASDISSMPPESLLETTTGTASANTAGANVAPLQRTRSRSLERLTGAAAAATAAAGSAAYLEAPNGDRSRSLSRERITQKVMEKLAATPLESSSRKHRNREGVEYEPDTKPAKERRRRSSRTQNSDDVVSPESSQLSSNITQSQTSYRSGNSKVSLNNPRLLEMVEDTVRRLILPEIEQLRGDRRVSKNTKDFEDSRRTSAVDRDSYAASSARDRDSYGESMGRSVSKSSSTPNIRSKPKVVLNRDEDNEGEVLSRGDSERRPVRRSSRESTSKLDRPHRRSSRDTLVEEEAEEDPTTKTKSGRNLRDGAAGALAGGILTAAALKHHDSQGEVSREKRKNRTKSRGSHSRSASVVETEDLERRDVPPMPFSGGLADSEMTRDSILSAATERPSSRSSHEVQTPLQEVRRGVLSDARSSPTVTPGRTPISSRRLHSRQSSRSDADMTGHEGHETETISSKARAAGLAAAAGLGGATLEYHLMKSHDRHDNQSEKYEGTNRTSDASPLQSVSSGREDRRDPLIPEALRPRSQASLNTLDRDRRRAYVSSPLSSPGLSKINEDRSPFMHDRDSFAERSKLRNSQNEPEIFYDSETPRREDMDEWLDQEHQQNERYRHSQANDSVQESLLDDDNARRTRYTDDTFEDDVSQNYQHSDKELRDVGAQPEFHTPLGVESAVASLLDPSMISSSMRSSQVDPARPLGSEAHSRTEESIRKVEKPLLAQDEVKVHQDARLSPAGQDFWSAARARAKALSDEASSRERLPLDSPRQSTAGSIRDEASVRESTPVLMSANALPIQGEHMPEIGHGLDEGSDVTTNPSDIQGPISSKERRAMFVSHEASPSPKKRDFSFNKNDDASVTSSHHDEEKTALLGAADGAGAALAAEHLFSDKEKSRSRQSISHRGSVEEDYRDSRGLTPEMRQAEAVRVKNSITPTSPPAAGDEGYSSGFYARSQGGATPRASARDGRDLTPEQVAEYEAAMGHDEEDPFTNAKHSRHLSANSHGMASPLYDSSTGKGIDRIQSQDVVALMDHLTVRDAHRNARDTEILVTLVRNATEMNGGLDDLKRFIIQQDKMIMRNTDKNGDSTVQRILDNTPRGNATTGSRTPRASLDEEDYPVKRKNVFKRALKGLGKRDNNDLARIEDMLMRLLDDVETLKENQGGRIVNRAPVRDDDMSDDLSKIDSLDSYERMRNGPDAGYEPSGRAGTGSTMNQSPQYPLSPRAKQNFHSGYDGRRDSINRVSTVAEGDEDEDEPLEAHERNVLDHEFQDTDRYGSPAFDSRRNGVTFSGTPPHKFADRSLDNSPDKQKKHKSSSSSLWGGIPKISRWSKTTTSSAPDGYDSRRQSTEQRPYSEASRSGESLTKNGTYYDDDYSVQSDDRLRSTQSLARDQDRSTTRGDKLDTRSLRSGHSRMTRTPSPLIPEAVSGISQVSTEGRPAVPSPGLTSPEDDDEYDDPKYQAHRNSLLLEHPQPRQGSTHRHQTHLETKAEDFHGDMGTDSDLSQRTADSDFDPQQWGSNPALSLARTHKLAGINPVTPRKTRDDGPLVPSEQSRQQTSNRHVAPPQPSYDSRMYYSSPLGSGHLLEPIPEVRYSLETDRDVHRSPTLTPEPEQVDRSPRLSSGRKITGPRPMGGRSSSSQQGSPEQVKRKPVGARSHESMGSETF